MDTGNERGKLMRTLTHAVDRWFGAKEAGSPRKPEFAAADLKPVRSVDVKIDEAKSRLRRLDGDALRFDCRHLGVDPAQSIGAQRVASLLEHQDLGEGGA